MCLQAIPQISSLSPFTTAIPLILVLGVTAAKDAIDDVKRHKTDKLVNTRRVQLLTNIPDSPRWEEKTWTDVYVGSIIRIEADEPCPADIIVLSTSNTSGECYIETAELDGEQNLKIRTPRPPTRSLRIPGELGSMTGYVIGETPNACLEKYRGTMHLGYQQESTSLSNDNIILRGCTLRNTAYVHGLVVFTGNDTKLMQNSGESRFKRTTIDQKMNFLVAIIFIFLVSMSLIMAIGSYFWEDGIGKRFAVYLPLPQITDASPGFTAFLNFFSYIILMNTMVPISLYVSVEMIRLGQSWLIEWDKEMYYAPTNTPAAARTTTLNEDLGQVSYIFTDKTGTLTCNQMTFLKCSIAGVIYSETGGQEGNFSVQPFHSQPVAEMALFFRALSICHTARAEQKNNTIVYEV